MKKKILDEAERAMYVKHDAICAYCQKVSIKRCKRNDYCLPLEMFIRLLDEPDEIARLEMLKNLENQIDNAEVYYD